MEYDVDIFRESTKPQKEGQKEKKVLAVQNPIRLLNERKKVFNSFKSKPFSVAKQKQGKSYLLDMYNNRQNI